MRPIFVPEVKDMLGRVVQEGDRIAVAMTSGRSATLHTGRVISISPTMIKVLWEGRLWTKATNIHHDLKKFIVINELPQQS